mmetsp:Transcript_10379/g.20485  ORF Transcript_10379/g.20485 Transcript_10379/m.20485 type:complete len:81 (-) Transcript_10379:196-438(-)
MRRRRKRRGGGERDGRNSPVTERGMIVAMMRRKNDGDVDEIIIHAAIVIEMDLIHPEKKRGGDGGIAETERHIYDITLFF